jgi:small conductance mechanosensitive channel
MNTDQITKQAIEMAMYYAPKLLGAIAVWVIGNWVIKLLIATLEKVMLKAQLDASLKPFLVSLAGALLKVMLVITVLGMLGVEMTSFIAVLGAAGLAVGMALSGTLQNFAGGVVLLVFKPYKVGDLISAQGFTGTVSEIQIFNTILKTPDNKTIIIPNGGLSTSSMTNFSSEERRRVDWTFRIGYGCDTEKAKTLLKQLADADSRILNDPKVFIALAELGDSSINFTMRAWVNAADYWGVFFAMNENVYKSFQQEGLNVPIPQMDARLLKKDVDE